MKTNRDAFEIVEIIVKMETKIIKGKEHDFSYYEGKIFSHSFLR